MVMFGKERRSKFELVVSELELLLAKLDSLDPPIGICENIDLAIARLSEHAKIERDQPEEVGEAVWGVTV